MKFILTKELGRLAKWLRILGFDTVYFHQDNLSSLIIQALRDGRMIITRNQRLLRQAGINTVLLKSEKLKEQITETLKALGLKPDKDLMFSRCIICNVELRAVEKDQAKNKVPAYVFETQKHFVACPNCERIYWEGTHWGNVTQIIKEIQLR